MDSTANTTITSPLIRRTIDKKQYYVRLATLEGTTDFWTTEIIAPRYFKTKKAILEYVQTQMVQPNRKVFNGMIINDRRKDI
jgi:hypothetical protein